jgi:hypothetical protein
VIQASNAVAGLFNSKPTTIRSLVYGYFLSLSLILIRLKLRMDSAGAWMGSDGSAAIYMCIFWLLVFSITGLIRARYQRLPRLIRLILTGLFRLGFLYLCLISAAAAYASFSAFPISHSWVDLSSMLFGLSVLVCLGALIWAHFRAS